MGERKGTLESSWKKILAIGLFFIGFIVLPLFLLSNPMMEYYQRRIDRNPDSGFSRWLQITSASLCYKTMRPEKAADYYWRFLERYRDDERRPLALLRYGRSLEEAGRNATAIEVYQQYLIEYPDREDKSEALAGIDRIRYIRPK